MNERRAFLKLVAVGGAAFALGIDIAACSKQAPAAAPGDPHAFAPNAFLRIDADGVVTVTIPSAEMGQSVVTTLAMLVAEELGADWHRVRAELAPADTRYAHPQGGVQSTGGSGSMRGFYLPMRRAGAAARQMLIAAGARRLRVAPPTCRVEDHTVIHGPSGTRLSFGELAAEAAKQRVPSVIFLKTPDTFRYIGKRVAGLDTPAKTRGLAPFGQDVQIPGMVIATVERAARFGAKPARFDADSALALPGVRHVFELESGIAVVADSFGAAQRGRAELRAEFDPASSTLNDAEIDKRLEAALRKPVRVRREGHPDDHLRKGALEAEYRLPYQAHACMEPMNCTAHVQRDRCELWLGTQSPAAAQRIAAEITGLELDQVRVNNLFLGGGFGRRGEQDVVAEAVRISKRIGAPVKLMWTREDDLRHDFYRPVSRHRLRAKIDDAGQLVAWEHLIASPSILARIAPAAVEERGYDTTSVEGAVNLPYAIPHLHVACARAEIEVPVGFWRSVGASSNGFVTECFIDEIAAAMKSDPLALRRKLLRFKPRHLRVLERVAKESAWGTPLRKGRARGVAIVESFGSVVAQVAEVSIEEGEARVHRVNCAVDCGLAVNPDVVTAQMESAIVFGLTAALKGAITIDSGAVAQRNFHDYPLLRMDETPQIHVHLLPSDTAPQGVGEPGVPPVAPAVANALFALTGKPIRQLPIRLTT